MKTNRDLRRKNGIKKAALAALCLILLPTVCGCNSKETEGMDITGGETVAAEEKTVTFINGAADADVWILPETEANLKTTVWGAATVPQVKAGESIVAPLCEPGDGGLYIFRMIDTDGFYYAADGIELGDGWTLRISGSGLDAVRIEVTDENGGLRYTGEVFAARL